MGQILNKMFYGYFWATLGQKSAILIPTSGPAGCDSYHNVRHKCLLGNISRYINAAAYKI